MVPDLSNAEPFAQQVIGIASEEPQLLALERAARERAERLQALTAALGRVATPHEINEVVLRQATRAFAADDSVVVHAVEGSPELEIVAATRMPPDVMQQWKRFPLHARVPLADAARNGKAIFLESRAAWTAAYSGMETALESTGHHANMVLPATVDGRLLGVIGLAYAAPRAFSSGEREFAIAFAGVCAQALDRARLYEAERRVRVDAERARAAAEAANKAKAQFLAMISHELRTPLHAISGHAELIDLGILGPVTAEQKEALSRIVQSQQYILGLINDLLSYAKIEAGHVELEIGDVDLTELIEGLEPLISPQMRAKALRYSRGATVESVAVRADPEKLRQILLNLLSNAIKFTSHGGSVSIRSYGRGDWVVIEVCDTGSGIPEERLEQIFEPFVQVDRRSTPQLEGTGLGLAISREFARQMDGEISASSALGQGSTFTLTLPRAATS